MVPAENSQFALIFGGSGFVGTHLTSEMLDAGFVVHVADILPSKNPNAIFHECDVRKEIKIDIGVIPDIVINLAAVHRTPGHDVDEYYETNIAGATNIARWCENKGARKIIFTSSISVYGPGVDLKDESSDLHPAHAYGKSKALAENIFRNWYLESPEEKTLIICRPAVIFGSGERGNYSRMAKAIKRKLFFIPGSKNLVKSSGYVGDLTRSILFMNAQITGMQTYNFCFPNELSIAEIASTMSSIGNWQKPRSLPLKSLVPILKRLGYPLSHVGNRIEKLLLPTRILPRVLIDMNFHWKYDLQSSLDEWYKESSFDVLLRD